VKFTITHLRGSRAGSTQELDGDVLTVGRDPQNQLAFDPVKDDQVSSFHASIAVQGGQVVVTDVGSRNGTYVNGHRIQAPTAVVSGSVLQFGEKGPMCAFTFGAAGAPAPAAPAATAAPAAAAPRVAPTEKVPAAAAAAGKPAAPAAGAPAAATPAAAKPAAPAAAKPAAPGSKSKGCIVLGVVLGLLLSCVIGAVGIALRRQISEHVPPGLMTYVQKIPIVNKIFKLPTGPRLPPGIPTPKLPTGGGGGTSTETSTDTTTQAPPAPTTPTTTDSTTQAPPTTTTPTTTDPGKPKGN
jgi:hypothetical protein